MIARPRASLIAALSNTHHLCGVSLTFDHCTKRARLMPARSLSFVTPVLMLFVSNIFMTFAWYGHLKFKQSWLPSVILVSWGIAFIEYCFAVPANRLGSAVYSAAQLKTLQEVVTLI